MSRTTLCVCTAAGLAALSLTIMLVRQQVLGDEIKVPHGPGTWKVTLVVHGVSTGDTQLATAAPLDSGRQHVLRESAHSDELAEKPADGRKPERRFVSWTKRAGKANGPFRARYECFCSVDPQHHTTTPTKTLYAAPKPGEYLAVETPRGSDTERVSALARAVTADLDQTADQAEALFHHVDREINDEPCVGGPGIGAIECLQTGSGDAGGKARLLLALLRSRGIPARLVVGLRLVRGEEQTAHRWVEAWVHEHWLPMCPFYHHYGRVPSNYLVFAFGDQLMVRGRHVRDLDHKFLVEKVTAATAAAGPSTPFKRFLSALSLYHLAPADQRLVEFLLLLPVAALIICVFRTVIGLNSFGTFAPALVGLAFRDIHSLPGIGVFVAILLLGWLMRRVLDGYHLLQVPRTAVMLTLVVLVLISAVVVTNHWDVPATRYVSLFPMIILTGMIERFWTLETEDSTAASFKTLLTTMFIAATIAVVLSFHALVTFFFRYPEGLGFILAGQLLLGRYTGYRLSELYRFRDLANAGPPTVLSYRVAAEARSAHDDRVAV